MSSTGQEPKLLFLYSELADYFLACIRKLALKYNVQVHIVHWPVNKEAPFVFDYPEGVNFYDRKEFNGNTLRKKIQEIAPDFIYCSGWMDKDYLAAIRGFKDKVPVVIGLDTKWKGTMKQYVACALSQFTLHKIFSHCWVPGNNQKKYALKLGFKQSQVMTGYYSANTDYFISLGKKMVDEKKINYPHKLIFAGRYYDFKGVKDLWEAFIQWQNEKENDWELWCLGKGDIEPISHPKIKHFGFVQPKEIGAYMGKTGVFIIPSRFEPWGVVLHEFAASGFPIISSDAVGANEVFMVEDENGYIYPAGDIGKLKESIDKITSLADKDIISMGEKSMELAMKITTDTWADTIMKMIESK